MAKKSVYLHEQWFLFERQGNKQFPSQTKVVPFGSDSVKFEGNKCQMSLNVNDADAFGSTG